MTVDDENSVYVGGLPHDATEDTIRKAFGIYGRVVAVKIVNDRGVGGKIYGFVTFTNPRAVIDAISDMNGMAIDGRVVKVNAVMSRGGRSSFGRDSSRHNSGRGNDWDRGRDRERDLERKYNRDRYHDRNRERSVDRDQDRERGYDRTRDQDQTRNLFMERDGGQDQDRDMKEIDQEHDMNHDPERDRDLNSYRDQDREFGQTNSHFRDGEKDKYQNSKSLNGSYDVNDSRSRELLPESSENDSDQYQMEKQLDISSQRLEELQKEVFHIEELVEEKGELVSNLKEKSQNLENELSMAKKLTSHRQMQLTKLHKCYLHMKEYREQLKSSEQELQSLVESTMIEVEYDD